MELYYSLSIMIVIATLFSYINHRFMRLPSTIGIMVIAIIVSSILVIIGNTITSIPEHDFVSIIQNIDFPDLLMDVMLSFLLFAGAININIQDLKTQKISIILFSTLSILISTLVIGMSLFYLSNTVIPLINIHFEIPLVYCLLFGALISPTDPIAVLSILKYSKVPKPIEIKVAGESLFNDGLAVVIFSILLKATHDINSELTFNYISILTIKEVLGGVVIGLLLGFIASKAIKKINDYKMSVLITLSVVMGGSLIAHFIEISGPLTMVFAGLFIGESKRRANNNDLQMNTFWELIDEIMNAILFLLIGFELLLIPNLSHYWLIGIICIIITLLARYISIKIPSFIMPKSERFSRNALRILVWGGLRGGVAIALALSLPDSGYKQILIASTYFVVVFSIIIQGLTLNKIVGRMKF